jgi:hypothetical protein
MRRHNDTSIRSPLSREREPQRMLSDFIFIFFKPEQHVSISETVIFVTKSFNSELPAV